MRFVRRYRQSGKPDELRNSKYLDRPPAIELPNAKAAPLQGAGRRSHYSKFAPVRVQRLLTRIPQNCTKVTRGSG